MTTTVKIQCACCKQDIPVDSDGFLDRCARITRGDFRYDEDGEYASESENVKYERFICTHCFLTDPDLCAFFNKMGDRIR